MENEEFEANEPEDVPSEGDALIPLGEIGVTYSRSSGPGGQNVNKVATKVQLRWPIGDSASFTDEEKDKIRAVYAQRITKADELIVASQSERSQKENLKLALERLNDLVERALAPQKERIPTSPSRGALERRHEDNRRLAALKHLRAKITEENGDKI